MEIITEAGPGSGEGGFCPFIEWAACFSKPVNYISQHPLCLPSFQSQCHHRSIGLSIHDAPPNSNCFKISYKTRNKDPNSAICYATVVHGAENEARHWRRRNGSELLFFFSSALLPQKTEGAGIHHADNCAVHNEQCLLENGGFLKPTGANLLFLVGVESFRRREEHAWSSRLFASRVTPHRFM